MTSADFVKAIQKADGVCILPMGSIEKFGPSAPLGTNVYLGRIIPLEAVKQEYAVIFPEYFVAETTDTSTLPGTIHYSMSMQIQFLDETTREMARNGCRKIILANGHTGNVPVINLFMATLRPRRATMPSITSTRRGFRSWVPMCRNCRPPHGPRSLGVDGHGGEERVAAMLAYYPDLIHLDRAHDESGSAGHGAEGPGNALPGQMTSLPTGYSGDASGATAARGHALVDLMVGSL